MTTDPIAQRKAAISSCLAIRGGCKGKPQEATFCKTTVHDAPYPMILWMWLIPVIAAALIVILVLYGMVKSQAGERTDGQIVVDKPTDER